MSLSEILSKLYSRLILLGWTQDDASGFVDGILDNRTVEAREQAIAWACHENDCLDIITTPAAAQWDARLFAAGIDMADAFDRDYARDFGMVSNAR